MAGQMHVGDVLEVVVRGVDQDQAINNVFHFIYSDVDIPVDPVDVTTALNVFIGNFQTLMGYFPTTYSVFQYAAYVINGRTANPTPRPTPIGSWTPNILTYGDQAIVAGGLADVGTLAGDALPTFNAWAARFVTQRRGRQYRGGARMRWGNEASTTQNKWNSPGFYDTSVGALSGALKQQTLAVGPPAQRLRLCVFGRRTYLNAAGTVNPSNSAFSSPVISEVNNRYVTSQVSRKQRQRFQ